MAGPCDSPSNWHLLRPGESYYFAETAPLPTDARREDGVCRCSLSEQRFGWGLRFGFLRATRASIRHSRRTLPSNSAWANGMELTRSAMAGQVRPSQLIRSVRWTRVGGEMIAYTFLSMLLATAAEPAHPLPGCLENTGTHCPSLCFVWRNGKTGLPRS